MLSINMRRGEYFIVGNDTVVFFEQLSSDRARLAIHAPKEVAIVRGTVWERSGNPPPGCLAKLPKKKHGYRPDAIFRWNAEREQAVRKIGQIAERLEEAGSSKEAGILREQIEQIVPAVWEDDLSIR